MSLTLDELKYKIIVNADELLVLELMDISTKDLLKAFEQKSRVKTWFWAK